MTKLFQITGKAISGDWGDEDPEGTDVPVLRTANFTNEGVFDFTDLVTRQIRKRNLSEKLLRKGDIVIEKSGGSDKFPVGRVVFFDGEEGTYLFNNFTGLLRVKAPETWLPRYVFYALFSSYRNGGTRPYENRTTGLHNLQTDAYVNNLDVPDRDCALQRRVCCILDTTQKIISTRRTQLAALAELVKARFVEMFGEPHGNPSARYVPIVDLVDVVSGGTPSRQNNDYWENGTVPWVKTTELHNGIIMRTEECITEKGLEESSAKIVPPNTVLIAMYGQGKTRGMTAFLGMAAATNQACACLVRKNQTNMHFLWEYLKLSYDKLRGLAQGGNQQNLSLEIIKNFPVMIPPQDKQDAFVSFVARVEKLKATIQRSLAETQRLFDSQLQEHFGLE